MAEYHNIPWIDAALDSLLAEEQRLPHALLLSGRPGLGKAQLAHRLAAALLCEARAPGSRACGQCAACGWIAQGSHPDLRTVTLADEESEKPDSGGKAKKPSTEIRLPQIRALAEFLSVGGHRGGRRVVLIHPADAMNTIAANALLKSLEEPQAAVMFLLVSSRPQRLPATIRSRCRVFVVPPPDDAQAGAWLVQATGASLQQATAWLAASGGSPLQAAEFAQAERAAVHRVIVETVERLPDTSIVNATDALASLAPAAWLQVLQAWVGDLGRSVAGQAPVRFPAHQARLKLLAGRVGLQRLTGYGQWLDQQAQLAAHPMNARLLCEQTLQRYTEIFA